MTNFDEAKAAADAVAFPIEDPDFDRFQKKLQLGEFTAVKTLFDEYAQRLVSLATQNIDAALLKRFDGDDVVQSVFRTFFRRLEEQSVKIKHQQQLWRLLVTITLCKTRTHARKHTAQMRGVSGERSGLDTRILGVAPAPEDLVSLCEEIDLAVAGLPDPTMQILALRLHGRSRVEIAELLGLSRQTIHRLLKLLEERLKGRFAMLVEEAQT